MPTVGIPTEEIQTGGTNSWIICVILCIIASGISNLGLNLQKLCWISKGNRRYWLCGLFCITLGSLCDFLALGFGSQSIVAPLGALTLVANVFIAPLIVGEKVTKNDILATLVIMLGCSLTVAFASHKEISYTKNDIYSVLFSLVSYIYFITISLALAMSLYAISSMEKKLKKYGQLSTQYQQVEVYHRFSYAAISGIIGAQSGLFAKILIELIFSSIDGYNIVILDWHFCPILAMMFICVSLQLYWLNCGLSRWDALYNVPIFQCFWIVVSVVSGGIVFQEFDSMTIHQAVPFCFGIFLCVVGVYFLSKRESLSRVDVLNSDSDKSTNHTPCQDLFNRHFTIVFENKEVEGLTLVSSVIESNRFGSFGSSEMLSSIHYINIWIVEDMYCTLNSSVKNINKLKKGCVLISINNEYLLGEGMSHKQSLDILNQQSLGDSISLRFFDPQQQQEQPDIRIKSRCSSFTLEKTKSQRSLLGGVSMQSILNILHTGNIISPFIFKQIDVSTGFLINSNALIAYGGDEQMKWKMYDRVVRHEGNEKTALLSI